MRRAAAVVAATAALLLLTDLAATGLIERRSAAALCGEPDVRLGPWPVAPRVVAGGTVDVTVVLDATDLAALVPLPPLVSTLAVEDGRLQLVTATGLTIPADLAVADRAVVITPVLGPVELDRLAIRLPLDRLPAGVELTEVQVGATTLTASGLVDTGRLDLQGTLTCPIGAR